MVATTRRTAGEDAARRQFQARAFPRSWPRGGDVRIAAATAQLTLGTSSADIVGATITIDTPGIYLILGVFDFEVTVSGVGQCLGELSVGGSVQAALAIYQLPTTTGRETVVQQWRIDIATPGMIVKLRARKTVAAGTAFAQPSHTQIAAATGIAGGSGGGGGGGVTDHGALTGLADDDHPQYVLESLLDAKGDLYVASAADTPGRLPVGANGLILQAASGETLGLKWASGIRNIVLTTGTGTTASATVPKQLVIVDVGVTLTISKIEVIVGKNETVTVASLIVDIHKILAANKGTDGAGTTLYTTQGNRPTITTTNRYSSATLPDVLTVAAGDALALYIDQSGTVTDVTVMITAA